MNVFGEALQPCRVVAEDEAGSWDSRGFCSEMEGGAHQICLKLPGDFSSTTKQGLWSNSRADQQHCVCLGAFSNYVSQQTISPDAVNCKAIPEMALSPALAKKWKEWNNVSVDKQAEKALEFLRTSCLAQAESEKEKRYFLEILAKSTDAFSPGLTS